MTCSVLLIFSLIFILQSKLHASSQSSSLTTSKSIAVNETIEYRTDHQIVNPDLNLIDITENVQNLNYENFFHTSRSKFLAPESIHLPFNPPSTIENISAIPIAYGDFDSDKYTDIFMLGNNGKSLHLLKGHSCVDGKTVLTFFGSRRCLSIVQNFHCHLKENIYNLAASDFTGRMHQDLLITVENQSPISKYNIILVYGNTTAEEFNCDQQIILIENASSEPFILGK